MDYTRYFIPQSSLTLFDGLYLTHHYILRLANPANLILSFEFTSSLAGLDLIPSLLQVH